jgi:hypothetical protein
MELLLSPCSSADPRAAHAGRVVRERERERVVYAQMHIVNLDAVFPNRNRSRIKEEEEILDVCGSISQTRPVLSSFSTV